MLPNDHPLRRLSEQTLVSRQSRGPLSAVFGDSGERLVMTHAINDPKGDLVGIMLIARNLEALSEMQSTVRYSRKLAALGRLSAGVAHEVKNPLNAMMIHLELLRQKFTPRVGRSTAGPVRAELVRAESADRARRRRRRSTAKRRMQHVEVIANEIRRLDQVVQGFLKFTRPEDLKLQPIVSVDAVRRDSADRPARSRPRRASRSS